MIDLMFLKFKNIYWRRFYKGYMVKCISDLVNDKAGIIISLNFILPNHLNNAA